MTPDPALQVALARAIGPTARELLGEPNARLSSATELRFGARGSLSIDLTKGTWFDHEAGEGGGTLDLLRVKGRLVNGAGLGWLEERGLIPRRERAEQPAESQRRKIVAAYDYRDAERGLLYQVVRYAPKDFRQRRPDPSAKDGWTWNMQSVQRVLYRLPEVLKDDGEPVYFVEGEKSADRLAALGLKATCSPGGANKFRPEYADWLNQTDLVILPDNDDVGRQHAAAVARAAQGHASRIRILNLPNLPPKGDVFDWLEAGGTVEQLEALCEGAPDAEELSVAPADCGPKREKQKSARPTREERKPTGLPLITVQAGELHTMATKAEDAVLAAGVAVYQRGDSLVRPVTRETAASHGRTTLAAGLSEVTVAVLLDVLCSVAEWERYDARAKAMVRTNPPRQVAEILLSRAGFWRVPVVVGVITTPTMRPDGSILSAPGYDSATRLYHAGDPTLTLQAAVQMPTRADAEKALRSLQALLDGFPLVDGVSRAVALSALITPVARGAIPVAPMTLFRAPTAGSGKSYLADVVSVILTGRLCPVITAAPDEAETEKRLVGLLLAGFPLVSLDNVNGELGGDLLCQLIERQFIRVRALGRSSITEIESRATALATGNNARVRGDMVRRTVIADLDAGMERPELRQFTSDPVATVQGDRSRYVSAALIVVRAYLLAGQPDRLPSIASFSEWSNLVRSALVWLGCDDPARSMEQAREDDPELGELREVLEAWREAFGSSAVTVRQAIDVAITTTPQADHNGDVPMHGATMALPFPALKDALLRAAGVRGVIDAKRLGYWLRAKLNRPAGGYCFKRGADNRDSVATWRVGSAGL